MSHRTMVMVRRTYLHIAVLTVLTAVLWLIISIYQSLTAPSVVTVDAAIRAPINPTFDEEVFNEIVGREDLGELSFVPPETASESAVVINEITVPETDPVEQTETATESAETIEEITE